MKWQLQETRAQQVKFSSILPTDGYKLSLFGRGPIALHGLVHFLNTIGPSLTKVIYAYFDRISCIYLSIFIWSARSMDIWIWERDRERGRLKLNRGFPSPRGLPEGVYVPGSLPPPMVWHPRYPIPPKKPTICILFPAIEIQRVPICSISKLYATYIRPTCCPCIYIHASFLPGMPIQAIAYLYI